MAKNPKQPWETEFEKTPGGSRVFRHEGGAQPDEKTAYLSEKEMEQISSAIEEVVGTVETVMHEIASDALHIDINVVPPAEKDDMYFLTTMGMCARPMAAPRGCDKYAELCIALPGKWPMSEDHFEKFGEDAYWPIRWLKILARFPTEHRTYLGPGHTIPNGDPGQPLSPRCKFTGFLIMPSPIKNLQSFKVGKREVTMFYIHPLFPEEMQFKLDKGYDALLDRFDAAELHMLDAANPKRVNVGLAP
jgi:Suppressor of fused protein (SUFU)